MVEVEIKIKIDSKEKLQMDLVALGFTKDKLLSEIDHYYNGVSRDFRKSHEALRLRLVEELIDGEVSSKSVQMTYKGPKLDSVSMSRVEHEVSVSSFETMDAILLSLGYKAVMPVIKLRQEYVFQDVTACVDSVDGLGDFLELETIVEDDSLRENALTKIYDILGKLGYSIEETTTTSYLSMLEKLG